MYDTNPFRFAGAKYGVIVHKFLATERGRVWQKTIMVMAEPLKDLAARPELAEDYYTNEVSIQRQSFAIAGAIEV